MYWSSNISSNTISGSWIGSMGCSGSSSSAVGAVTVAIAVVVPSEQLR